MNRKSVGNVGESWAIRYLEGIGYLIIDTNVRPMLGMRRGEIDIVAWDADTLCIIEVKTRASRRFDATDAITVAKRRQLTHLAEVYVQRHDITTVECRFDVVCVYNRIDDEAPKIELFKGAFDPVR